MYKICVFGGTTEGRELVEFLNAQPCEVTACVATEYGQALLPEAERLTVSARRLPADEIKALLTDRQFDLVIDATHPYAASITKSIARACAETGVERWRLLRGASDAPEDAVFVESTEKAIEFLDQTEGNILLTTGSKELKAYSQIKDFAERVYARVLRVGVGCRKGISREAVEAAIQTAFASHDLDLNAVKGVYSIDLKRQEAGLLAACEGHGWSATFYTAEELRAVTGEFTESPFVQGVTGIGNVCERAAMLGAERLLVRKCAGNGVTIAVSAETWEVDFG